MIHDSLNPFAVDCLKPWNWAKVTVKTRTVMVSTVDDTVLAYDLSVYTARFGAIKGSALHNEFESALELQDDVAKKMRVFLGIWRVLGRSWTEHIAQIVNERLLSPPECT